MNYIEIVLDERAKEKSTFLVAILKRILPAANPDLEKLYTKTKYWWLEYDDKGLPNREIGFDENRIPIVLGPVGENTGFLTDSSDNWSGFQEKSEEVARNFEDMWRELWPRFKRLENDS